MRRFFFFALLASAAVPAWAAGAPDEPQHGRRGHAEADQSSNDDGGQRPAFIRREAQSAAPANDGGDRRPGWVRGQGGMSGGADAPDNRPRSRWQGGGAPDQPAAGQVFRHGPRAELPGRVTNEQGATQPQSPGGFSERLRQYRLAHPRNDGAQPGRDGNVTPPTNNSPVRSTFTGQRDNHWSGGWRNDHRYDWSQYRHQHRSLFHFGVYYDPYGYGYNRMMPGWSMWPNYFQSSYWLNDPWMYRLPPAYGPYRWVRYWDDALLVNTYSGEVVDVVYDFFW